MLSNANKRPALLLSNALTIEMHTNHFQSSDIVRYNKMGSGRTERRRRNKQRYISKQQAQIEALQKQLSDKKSFESPATAAVEVCDNPSLKKQRQHIQPTPIPNHSALGSEGHVVENNDHENATKCMRTKASAEYGGYLETNNSVLGSEGHVVKNNDDQNAIMP